MATPAAQTANTTAANQANVTFNTGERVLCYHGPLVYEAKILKTENHTEPAPLTGIKGMHYFVHYKGWKQTWDEWVPQQRLLKLNEANLQLQKTLQTEHSSTSHGGGGSSSASTKAHKSGATGTKGDVASGSTRTGVRKDGRGTKRAREEDESSRKPDMKLNVPEALKAELVDDWERITKNSQTVSLPRSPNVAEILQQFSEYVLKKKPPHLRDPNLVLPTITSGIQCYFDKALGMNLLYRFERVQYSMQRKKYWTGQDVVVGTEKEMSYIYGAEHLLRMIVNLPQMVGQSSLDPDSVSLIRDYVNELLQYMLKEQSRLFLKDYTHPPPAYQNVARS